MDGYRQHCPKSPQNSPLTRIRVSNILGHMRLQTTGGQLSAVAESVSDMQFLISSYGAKEKTKAPIKRRGRNAKVCEICGERKKGMKLHIKLAHPDRVRVELPTASA